LRDLATTLFAARHEVKRIGRDGILVLAKRRGLVVSLAEVLDAQYPSITVRF